MAQGLCPRCLLQGALTFDSAAEVSPAATETVLRYFGDYELLHEIARGGMGIVYQARQVRLNRLVALKVLAAGDFASAEFVERFRREAEVAATLEHPNIVPIFEVGAVGGQAFFSMRLIDGGTLIDHLKKAGGRLSNPEAATLLVTIARAVHYAHQRGVLHRDLKPGNVLIDSRAGAMLTDFGLAKLVEQESTVTQTQELLGTPAYMSPEQASGRTRLLTTAADVYGLGAILYELLTGEPPFRGASSLETVRQVLEHEPKPPTMVNPKVDRDLEVICLKCLEKEPERRYGSAEALADDLDRWLRCEPIRARASGTWERTGKWIRRNPRRATLLASTVVAALAAATGLAVLNARLREANSRAGVRAEQNRQHLVQFNVAKGVDLMNDGDLFGALPWFVEALKLDQGIVEQEEIHRTRIAAVLRHTPRLIQVFTHGGADASSSFFSPDGRQVLVRHGEAGFVQLWGVESGQTITPQLRHNGVVLLRPMFSLAGERILTGGQEGTARLWDARTGEPILPPLQHASGMMLAAFSPDNRLILTAGGDSNLRLFDANTGRLERTVAHTDAVMDAEFRTDGRQILSCARDGSLRLIETLSGEVQRTLKHPGSNFPRWVRYSADGRRFMSNSGQGTLVWDTETGQPLTPLLGHSGLWVYGATLNAEGNRLLSWGRDATARLWDVSTNRLSLPVLRHEHGVRMAEFSPDGRYVVTASDDQFVRVWEVTTGELAMAPMRHGGRVFRASFSPDGQRIVSSDATTTKVWSIPNNAATLTVLVEGRPRGAMVNRESNALVTVDADRRVQAWSLVDGTERPFLGWTNPATLPSLERAGRLEPFLSPDLKTELFPSANGILVRDPQTHLELAPPLRHREDIGCATMSADGRLVATGSEDRTARVWDAKTGWPLTPGLRVNNGVNSVKFDPEARCLVTMSGDNRVTLWNLEPDRRSISDLEALAKLLAGRKINAAGGMVDLSGSGEFRDLWESLRAANSEIFSIRHDELEQWNWNDALNSGVPERYGNAAKTTRERVRLARWYRANQRWHEAAQALTLGLQSDPESPVLHWERGECFLAAKQFTSAETDFAAVIQADPESSQGWAGRASAQLAQGRFEGAKSDIERALEIKSGDPDLLELQGRIQTALRRWDEALASYASARAQRALIPVEEERIDLRRIPPRRAEAGRDHVDLGTFFNAPLTPGWMVPLPTEARLGGWPEGFLELGGISFEVRGVIQLASAASRDRKGSFPVRSSGIPIRRACRAIHFLHGAHLEAFASQEIGAYTLIYSDGTSERVPLVFDLNLRHCWSRNLSPLPDPNTALAWKFERPGSLRPTTLYRTTWANPRPDSEVVMIDYESAMKSSGPFLLAITLE
ncbi:MAG TPA: protein kinase [Verrucomicrobiota bacterium]|nr:protein kinase [Verrucomicrobiota bacterium]